MMRFARVLVRFSVVWILEALSLLAMSVVIPGIALEGSGPVDLLAVAMSAALVLAVMNGLVRPVLILLTLPLNVRTFGVLTLFINGAMLLLTSYFLPYFEVSGWAAVLLGPLVLTVVNTILSSITTIEDDYSFFDGVVQWLSKRQVLAGAAEQGRGLVMLEIDGLSYPSIRHALDRGLMPTVGRLMRDGTHALSTYDCGIPSQTSSCQAGIMYGDNFDIPAFRWYEKDHDRLMVSNHFNDAAEMNARYAHGHGLLRQGSSTNNLMAGDAAKVLLTMSVLRDNTEDEKRRRDQDLYLFWLNPYIMPRSIILSLWDVVVELYEGVRQRVRNVEPRINRLEKGYPVLRALTNVFLRNVSTYVVIL
ncbi:MAG: phage holin family protein, partial [Chloroflexi bacterium]|nr:phage holin family protein [Chloroflexota bacterium]